MCKLLFIKLSKFQILEPRYLRMINIIYHLNLEVFIGFESIFLIILSKFMRKVHSVKEESKTISKSLKPEKKWRIKKQKKFEFEIKNKIGKICLCHIESIQNELKKEVL